MAVVSGLALLGCQESEYRAQTRAASRAVQAMGGGGFHADLAHAPGKAAKIRIELSFRGREIDDAAITHLRGLTGVVGLDVSETKITDAGLAVISTLPDLEYLQLAETTVTDAGLDALVRLKHLSRLDIRGTRVTNGAKPILQRVEALDIVYAKGTELSEGEGFEINVDDDLGPFWVRSK